ncbi:MAG: sigma-70 family RNA polymerase sigma factor [Treponema sp.]|nr:sigma-70 family RNA polymerase sigma factor [Treponema sp.]
MESKKYKRQSNACLELYFQQIKNIPLLSFEEELSLARLIARGNKQALSRLIQSNLRLVVKIAYAFKQHGEISMDVIQEGNIGLMRAAEKFDADKNVRFSTYATWWIRQAILRSLGKERHIHLSRGKEDMLRKIHKCKHSLNQLYARAPNSEEIAATIGASKTEVENLLNASQNFENVQEEGDNTFNPELALMRKSFEEDTVNALNTLNEGERKIIIWRYELNGNRRVSLKKIGNHMGVSAETVRQTEKRALVKLRSDAAELHPYILAM